MAMDVGGKWTNVATLAVDDDGNIYLLDTKTFPTKIRGRHYKHWINDDLVMRID